MYNKELEAMIKVAKMAQKVILDVYHNGFEVEIKEDDSPVTIADKKADQLIREELSKEFPTYGFLTEESEDTKERLSKEYIFIVDPLDGTADFVAKDDEFTTNIALCRNHEIVAGVIAIPARNEFYYASKGDGAFKIDAEGNVKRIHVNDKTTDLTLLVSHFHSSKAEQDIFENNKDRVTKMLKVGSSLKSCLVAEGKGELNIKLDQGTKEWDVAPSSIIVKEAGGIFLNPDLTEMKFNREDVYNRQGYVVMNRIENKLY